VYLRYIHSAEPLTNSSSLRSGDTNPSDQSSGLEQEVGRRRHGYLETNLDQELDEEEEESRGGVDPAEQEEIDSDLPVSETAVEGEEEDEGEGQGEEEEGVRYAASQPVSKTVSTTDMEAMEDHLGRPVSRLQRSNTLPSHLVSDNISSFHSPFLKKNAYF